MILLPFLLQAYDPEVEAVMKRSQQRAAEKRAGAASQARPAAAAPLSKEAAAKFQACLDAAIADPEAGARFADEWRLAGGGFNARQCQGFAYARAERWAPATVAFEQAADEAERSGAMVDSGRLLAQAGNAALAGGDAAKARAHFDAALARGLPDGLEKGEVFLDRARAKVALGETAPARADIENALKLTPQDPLAWLLSATLARRMNDLALAQQHIAQAVKLSPDDASVALEEGNIAVLGSRDDAAKAAWDRAVKIAPDTPTGKAAADNLARLAKPAE
jgi:tetratricopeptide (TPR) repeat protein